MGLKVIPYQPELEAAAQAFNQRLRLAGELPFPLPERTPVEPPGSEEAGVHLEHFLVVDDGGEVRGGYFTKTQPFQVAGEVRPVAHYTAPLSEGTVNKRYIAVGHLMLMHALRRQPLLYAMGMGGMDRPLPRMLKSLKWEVREVPFFFLVLNGYRFLRNVGPLRSSLGRRLAADLLAFTGLGGMGLKLVQSLRRKAPGRRIDTSALEGFDGWIDQVWENNRAGYSFAAMRDARVMRHINPELSGPYYGVRAGDSGWLQMLDCTPLSRSYFGEMKTAAVLDGVAPAGTIPALVEAGVAQARARGVDLVFSNQMHRDWIAGLKAAGFWQGPSNFLLALSPELTRLLEPLETAVSRIHFNRGDGDGRVNLLPRDDAD